MLEPGAAVLVDITGDPDYYEWTEPATLLTVARSGMEASVRLASGEERLLPIERIEPARPS